MDISFRDLHSSKANGHLKILGYELPFIQAIGGATVVSTHVQKRQVSNGFLD